MIYKWFLNQEVNQGCFCMNLHVTVQEKNITCKCNLIAPCTDCHMTTGKLLCVNKLF